MTTTKRAIKLKKTRTKKTNNINNATNTTSTNTLYQKQYLTGKELAKRWGVSHRTVQRWRLDSVGLPYIKIGDRIVRYSLDIIQSYEKVYGPQLVIDINWGLEW